MEMQSSSSWKHSFSTLYVLRTHTTKAHPEILLLGWFLASQEKNQDKNQNNDNRIIQNNKEQRDFRRRRWLPTLAEVPQIGAVGQFCCWEWDQVGTWINTEDYTSLTYDLMLPRKK